MLGYFVYQSKFIGYFGKIYKTNSTLFKNSLYHVGPHSMTFETFYYERSLH